MYLNRNFAVVGCLIIFHVALILALQSGLMGRAVETIVPVEMISSIISAPPPKPEPTPPAPSPPPKQLALTKIKSPLPPAPRPMAIADPTPAPNAPSGVTTPQAPLPPIQSPVAASAGPAASSAAPSVVLPSSDAVDLDNPDPNYPSISRRLGESGRVRVRVLIGVDGTAQKVELAGSSGYDRLDQSALENAKKRRYLPGKVGGVPQAMWWIMPFNFDLKN